MVTIENEIRDLEERLRQAELGPDPQVFETLLDDSMVLMFDQKICQPKKHIVEAHTPGKGQKFDSVKVSEMEVVEHGDTAVVTCTGEFDGPNGRLVMKFMRVWTKKADDGWKIIAGSMFTVGSSES